MAYIPPIKGKYLKKKPLAPPDLAASVGGITQIETELHQLKSDVVSAVNSKIEEVSGKLQEFEDAAQILENTKTEAISLIKEIKIGPAGIPGKDADEQQITSNILSQISTQNPKIDNEELTATITKRVLKAIPENKASLKIIQEKLEVDPMSVIEKIMALPEGKFKLKSSQIDGLEQTISAFRSQLGRGYLHGGGDTVVAGTNITITTNSSGNKVISATGSTSPLTTKGDLYTFSTVNARLGVGSNGQILSADSTATTGLKWIAAPATLTLETNGVANGSQSLLNLVAGTNITLTDNGTGNITIAASGGTVSSVASADGSITVTNPTSTVDLAVVKAPKLSTARTIGGVSFDGTANITVATATGGFTVSGGALALGVNDLTMTGSLGTTGARLTKGWFTDLQVTNAIAGSVTGNAGTVTNATLTTALTVNTGTVTLTGNAANTSVLTIGAGAVSVSGANTGDQTITLTGEVTGSGTGSFATTLTNSAVIGKVLTGYTSGAGTVASTDTILQAIQKLNGNDATNANLTGVITSVGNATSIASQTGTGTKFVVDTAPTFVTSITDPLVIGGTGTTSPLTLRSTSGVGTTGADIIFQTGNNGATEAMRILNNGNVGIGTANPSWKFEVNKSSTYNSESTAGINVSTGTNGQPEVLIGADVANSVGYIQSLSRGTSIANLALNAAGGNVGVGTTAPASYSGYTTLAINNATNGGVLDFLINGTRYGSIYTTGGTNLAVDAPNASGNIVFNTAGSQKMTILSGGNLGIGTTNPGEKLEVGSNNNTDSAVKIRYSSVPGYFSTSYDGSTYAYSGISNNSRPTGASYTTPDNSSYDNLYFRLQSATGNAGRFLWSRANATAGTPSVSDLMALTSAGNLGIGTLNTTQKLQVAGNIFADGASAGADTHLYLNNSSGNTKVDLNSGGASYFTGGNVGIGTTTTPSILTVNGLINMKNYTVATLPAGTRGDIAYCTDLLAPGFLTIVVGGGTVVGPVFYNGSNWVAF